MMAGIEYNELNHARSRQQTGKSHELKKKLFGEYGGFADERIKNLSKSDVFIADDRAERDLDARKRLFYWFCEIHVRVVRWR